MTVAALASVETILNHNPVLALFTTRTWFGDT